MGSAENAEPESKVQKSEGLGHSVLGLSATCENRRQAPGAPNIVEPAAVPAPTTIAAAKEIEEAPIAVRVAENSTRQFEPGYAEVLVEPFQGRLTFFFKETLSNSCVEADVFRRDMPHKLLLARDSRLALFEAHCEECLGKVDLGERERGGILSLFARKTIALFRPAPYRPVVTEKCDRIERPGAVDNERARTFHDERKAVVHECNESVCDVLVRESLGTAIVRRAVEFALVEV